MNNQGNQKPSPKNGNQSSQGAAKNEKCTCSHKKGDKCPCDKKVCTNPVCK